MPAFHTHKGQRKNIPWAPPLSPSRLATPCCLSLLPCLRKFFAREASRSVSILSCSSNSGHTINVENCLVTPPNVVCSSKERRPPTAFASISITNILWFAAYETVSQLKANCNRPVDQPQLDASAFVTCLSRSSFPSKPRPSTARQLMRNLAVLGPAKDHFIFTSWLKDATSLRLLSGCPRHSAQVQAPYDPPVLASA